MQTERTALHIAAHNRQPEIIAELLAANAPPDAKDAQGAVPLHVAVTTGDAQTVAELLGRGAKVRQWTGSMRYTLTEMAEECHTLTSSGLHHS